MRAGIECKISFAKKLPITLGGLRTLSFDLGTFANASDRYITAKNPSTGLYEMTGPFGANVPAIVSIGGKQYIQIEESAENVLTQSVDHSTWNQIALQSVTLNAATAPDGTTTATSIIPNTTLGTHIISKGTTIPVVTGNDYTLAVFAKAGGYGWLRLYMSAACFPAALFAYVDLVNAAVGTVSNCSVEILSLEDDGCLILLHPTAQTNATGNQQFEIDFAQADGVTSWTPNGTDGYLLWHSQLKLGVFNSSLIPTVGSAVIRTKDNFYWANAVLPNYLKGSTALPFSFNFIPNYSSTQHATKAQDTYLFSVDGTENVECYIAGADQKLYIDVDSVNKFTSASAFAWDLHDTPKVSIVPNTGSGCRVITSGFNSGNDDETGTAFSMQSNGDLYLGLRHTTDDLQINGLISEIRNGLT